jgi:uncharacterized membrane protein
VRIPWTAALAHSHEITCPACHARLELSRFTRVFSAFGGITGAFITLHLIRAIFRNSFWATPIVVAILAFGFFSGLCVLIAGDLAVRPKPASTGFPHPSK